MSEIKEQDRKKDQEGQAAIKRLSKPIKVRILLAQIFTILSALLSFVPYLALVWLGDIFLSAQATGEQINAVQVHKVVNLLVMAFPFKIVFPCTVFNYHTFRGYEIAFHYSPKDCRAFEPCTTCVV